MGRSRGGLTTKIHTLVDAKGLPFRFLLTPGQSHDATAAQILLQELWPDSFVLADKAYDADWIRACIEAQEAVPIIPDRSNRNESHMPSAHCSIACATKLSVSLTRSNISDASPHAARSSPPTTSP